MYKFHNLYSYYHLVFSNRYLHNHLGQMFSRHPIDVVVYDKISWLVEIIIVFQQTYHLYLLPFDQHPLSRIPLPTVRAFEYGDKFSC